MYGIVPGNIGLLQAGIQFTKGTIEYSLKYGENEHYKKWAKGDKEVVILDGGTTNSRRFNGNYIGDMNRHLSDLSSNDIKDVSVFYEPELGDQLTSIVFMLDSRIWDRKKYPDYDGPWITDRGKKINPVKPPYNYWLKKFGNDEEENKKIFFLRNFLDRFRIIL